MYFMIFFLLGKYNFFTTKQPMIIVDFKNVLCIYVSTEKTVEKYKIFCID